MAKNILKLWYYHRWLHTWAGNSDMQGVPDIYIKRRYERHTLYVDLYWVMCDRKTKQSVEYCNRVELDHFVSRVKQLDKDILELYANEHNILVKNPR